MDPLMSILWIRFTPSKCATLDHAIDHNHVIYWQDAQVLAKECFRYQRSDLDQMTCTQFNEQRQGLHCLNHAYDPLLSTPTSCDCWNRRGNKSSF